MIFGLLVGDNPRLFYLGGLRREAKTLTPPTPSTQTASQLTSEIWRPAETDPGTYFPSQLGHISTRFTPSSWIDHDRVFCSTFHFNKSHFLSRIKTTLRASTLSLFTEPGRCRWFFFKHHEPLQNLRRFLRGSRAALPTAAATVPVQCFRIPECFCVAVFELHCLLCLI